MVADRRSLSTSHCLSFLRTASLFYRKSKLVHSSIQPSSLCPSAFFGTDLSSKRYSVFKVHTAERNSLRWHPRPYFVLARMPLVRVPRPRPLRSAWQFHKFNCFANSSSLHSTYLIFLLPERELHGLARWVFNYIRIDDIMVLLAAKI